jgi:hypothetical protein
MLHPALAQALATAHLEDLQRAAARRHTIRLARRSARGSRRSVDEAERRDKEPGRIGRRVSGGGADWERLREDESPVVRSRSI